MVQPRHWTARARSLFACGPFGKDRVLERADGRLRMASVRGGDVRRRARRGGVRGLHRRRRRRLGARSSRGRGRRPDLVGLDRRRRLARAAGGQGASRRRRDPMLIAGNWKMYKGPREAGAFCRALRDADLGGVDVAVCPPYVSLAEAVQALAGTEIGVFAQNCHWEREGPFTGEISAPMLRELGVYGTIVGHSERRQHFGETDETVARRMASALEHGLQVIAGVGELEAEREAGETEAVLRRQVEAIAAALPETDDLPADGVVLAYEPVWAIGTGRTANKKK